MLSFRGLCADPSSRDFRVSLFSVTAAVPGEASVLGLGAAVVSALEWLREEGDDTILGDPRDASEGLGSFVALEGSVVGEDSCVWGVDCREMPLLFWMGVAKRGTTGVTA